MFVSRSVSEIFSIR